MALVDIITLLDAVLVAGAGSRKTPGTLNRSFQGYGSTTSGSGTAVIAIQCSNVETPSVDGDWVTIGRIRLTLGTDKVSDGFESRAPWKHVRANLESITGTGAAVTAVMGV